MLMSFWVGETAGAVAMTKSLPGSHRPSVVRPSSRWWKPPPKSNPPQNDRPAPRRTITSTAASRTAVSTACSTSSGIGGTIMFNQSGRLYRIVS